MLYVGVRWLGGASNERGRYQFHTRSVLGHVRVALVPLALEVSTMNCGLCGREIKSGERYWPSRAYAPCYCEDCWLPPRDMGLYRVME